jgi:hypothetical protein
MHGTLGGSLRAICWGWCTHRISARWLEPGSARGTSHRGWPDQRPVDPTGWATSYTRGRHRCRGGACARGCRCGASDCRGCCRRSQPVVEARWCCGCHGWARVDSVPLMSQPRLPQPPPPLAPVAEEGVDPDHGLMALQLTLRSKHCCDAGAFRLLCCRSLE